MGRPVMLSNGSLMVGLNEHGLVNDFYYPYVGLDNLSTARIVPHKIGIWVDNQFSWVDDGSWEISVDFESDWLVSDITMKHAKLQLELHLQDFVDPEYNAFMRKIQVKNLGEKRTVRVFMHQAFQISRSGRADTALFVPDENYILDYKGRCCLLIYGVQDDGTIYDQFAIGNYGIEGKEGTFRDAEDGVLSGSAVEHGGVDSVIRFELELEKESVNTLDYWVVAADSQYNAERLHNKIKKETLDGRLEYTRNYWHSWFATASNGLHAVDGEYLNLVKKSLMVIKAHIDRRGGIIASGDSSIYNYGRDYYSYVWPRDGAYAIWPLIRLGYTEEPKRFFEFCRDILSPDGYLMHKYQPDRAIGSTWHPMLHGNHKELAIQEDETAVVIYMLGEYCEHSGDQEFARSLYSTLIQPAANFMESFIDTQTGLPHASYDLWEEKFLTNTYTVAVVYKALQVAATFAEQFEYPDDAVHWQKAAEQIQHNASVLYNEEKKSYHKGYLLQDDNSVFDTTIDISSAYGSMMFGLYQATPDHLHQSMKTIKEVLLDGSPSGGAPRYEHDHYFESAPAYQGNPWLVTTLWLAQYYLRAGNPNEAKRLVNWCTIKTLPSGIMPEQVEPTTSAPLSVAPLVWSHAEFVNTVLDLAKVD